MFWIVVLQKTLESPLDCKEVKPVSPSRNQPWIFTGRTDAEAEAPILWPHDAKGWLTGKDLDMLGKTAGKRRGGGLAEDEMFRSYYQLNGHEFEQTPRDNEGQGSLACCSPWGHKVRQDLETEQQRQIKGMFSLVNSEFKEQWKIFLFFWVESLSEIIF